MSAPEQPESPGTEVDASAPLASPRHRRVIEQERARQAWDDVREAKTRFEPRNEGERKKAEQAQDRYRSQALGLNAMIQINGLGQTLAFLMAKGKVDERQGSANQGIEEPGKAADALLFWHLSDWVGEQVKAGQEGLLHWITHKASVDDYRRATVECMAFGVWLRRFAEAELKKSDDAAEQRGNE